MKKSHFLRAKIFFGNGAIRQLEALTSGSRVLVLSGRHAREDKNFRSKIDQLIGKGLTGWLVVPPFPNVRVIGKAILRARHAKVNTIVGIGGGSVMDTAKLTAVLAPTSLGIKKILSSGAKNLKQKLKLILVPTLFGSGSEVTPFAVVYDNKKKYSIDAPIFQADWVLSDPDFGLAPPALPATAAAVDALSQAIESLWSNRATEQSARNGWRALKLLSRNYPLARNNARRRSILAAASLCAGMAIGVSRTTAAHALSYSLTILYGIPHGIACGTILPGVFLFNASCTASDCLHPRGLTFLKRRMAAISRELGGKAASPAVACRVIKALIASFGAPLRARSYGVKETVVKKLSARVGNPERLKNNPRRLTREAILDLYRQAV